MFNQIKDLYQLKQQAAAIQKSLSAETITVEKKGITITMNGQQKIIELHLNPELSSTEQEQYLKEILNDCLKKIQTLMAQKMMGGNFGL
jgi:DNA-binding protein YbaB